MSFRAHDTKAHTIHCSEIIEPTNFTLRVEYRCEHVSTFSNPQNPVLYVSVIFHNFPRMGRRNRENQQFS